MQNHRPSGTPRDTFLLFEDLAVSCQPVEEHNDSLPQISSVRWSENASGCSPWRCDLASSARIPRPPGQAPPLDRTQIRQLGFLIAGKQQLHFSLEIGSTDTDVPRQADQRLPQ
jgi:hypothetical protein